MADVIIKCPTCEKVVAWIAESEFKPFCSQRCRLIDLGEWAAGNHVIAPDQEYDDVMESDLSDKYRS